MRLKYGTVIDPSLEDQIKVTVIATGFPSDSSESGIASSVKATSDGAGKDSRPDGNYVSLSEFKNIGGKDFSNSLLSSSGNGTNREGLDVPAAMRSNRINLGKSFGKDFDRK